MLFKSPGSLNDAQKLNSAKKISLRPFVSQCIHAQECKSKGYGENWG